MVTDENKEEERLLNAIKNFLEKENNYNIVNFERPQNIVTQNFNLFQNSTEKNHSVVVIYGGGKKIVTYFIVKRGLGTLSTFEIVNVENFV